MNKQEIQKEIEHIVYLLGMKQVTRFGFERTENDPTESVAEHVYGLFVLAKYFLPLVDPEHKLDWQKIYDMILWHDTGEIETGDIPMFQKTEQHDTEELQALELVKDKSPKHLSVEIYNSAMHYETEDSQERKFMKAIDKLESAFSLRSNTVTAKMRFAKQQVTHEMFVEARTKACGSYPLLLEFGLEIGEYLKEHKTFCDQ